MKKSLYILSIASMFLGLVLTTGCEKAREKHEEHKHNEQSGHSGEHHHH